MEELEYRKGYQGLDKRGRLRFPLDKEKTE
jgi:hypothetical protein